MPLAGPDPPAPFRGTLRDFAAHYRRARFSINNLRVDCHVHERISMSTELTRVLVVDDDIISARAVRLMLERLGCVAETVDNGAQAVESFRVRDYDLILMTWGMPVMDGFEATARIRALPRGQATPIIGTSSGRDRAECIAAGMNDLIPKPYRIEKLRLILSRWTAWAEQRGNTEAGVGSFCL